MYYLIPRDETSIIYEVLERNKIWVEKIFTFKGKFIGEKTYYNVENFLKNKLLNG